MNENMNNEKVFELPAEQKRSLWIVLGILAAALGYLIFFSGIPTFQNVGFGVMAMIMLGVVTWVLIPIFSHRYVISNETLVYTCKNFWLQEVRKEIPLKEIAKAEHTQMFFILYNQYDKVLLKAQVNNFITPQVYEELNLRMNLQPVNRDEKSNVRKWLLPVLAIFVIVLNVLRTMPNISFQRKPTKATEQYALGERYRKGEKVEKNYVQAVFWTRKAAEQGLAEAQNAMGNYYRQGVGVEQRIDSAFYWYQRASKQGYALAQFHLGQCYRYGRGVNPNIETAVYWYRKAAEQGHAEAQVFLGICYEYGYGVGKNYQKALDWYQKAQKDYTGNRDIEKYIRRCTRKMGKK